MVLGASQKLILAFVTLILGAVLIGVIATNALAVTDTTSVLGESGSLSACYDTGSAKNQVNESAAACNFTVANNPTGWKTEDCPLTSVVVYNGTGTVFTLDTDYQLFASSGVIQFLNTSDTEGQASNATTWDYNYCGDDYMNLSWGRTLLNLVAGFFAIALLMVGVGLFFSIARDYGII